VAFSYLPFLNIARKKSQERGFVNREEHLALLDYTIITRKRI
jgi:hypothetical protein